MKTILILALLLGGVNSLAAKETGNGGGSFVCRNAAGDILTAELVDTYEARNQLGLKIRDFGSATVDARVELMQLKVHQAEDAGKAPSSLAQKFDASIGKVRDIMRFVDNVILENTNDFQISISPKICKNGQIKFEQLASYTPTGDLIVDKEIYQKLSQTDQALLYVHEALYLLARELHGSESSLEARRATGYLASTVLASNFPEEVLSLEPAGGSPNTRWVCSATFLHKSCFENGCYLTSYSEDERKNTVLKFGKTFVEASSQLREVIAINKDFNGCVRYSSDYAQGYSDYHYRKYQCDTPASIENACYQQHQ